MADRFKEEFDRAQNCLNEVKTLADQRKNAEASGGKTGPIEYKLKNALGKLRKESTQLEQVIYLYETGDAQYSHVARADKNKRVKLAKPVIEEAKQVLITVKLALDSKKQIGANLNDSDNSPEGHYQRKTMTRDEDGEFEETKGLSNQQVLEQNKAQLAA